MSFAGLSRPMRAAGFALIGLAAIAAVIGTASVLSSDGPDSAAPGDGTPTQTTTAPGSPETTGRPTTPPSSPPGSPTGPATPGTSYPSGAPGENGGTATTAPKPDGRGDTEPADATRSAPVRVYNNSTIRNLAGRAAEDLRAQGWKVVEVGNYAKGIIPTSTAYFRPGTSEKAAAEVLGKMFGLRVEPRFEGIKDASPGVIVIVTRDYQGAGSGGKY